MSLTVGSLFSGIGGLDLGLERAGLRVVWQCESDRYAQAVLKKHWPHVPIYDDVRDCGGERRLHWLDRVDLICGGFPCQDISNAGKRGGISGERSGLWKEYARIVDELRPTWVLIENVPALRTRGLRTVLSDLHACGYDAEWDGLPAVAFGAPHRRDRIFVVAYARSNVVRVEQGRVGGQNGAGAPELARDAIAGNVANADSGGELQPQGRVFNVRGRVSDSGNAVATANRQGLAVGSVESSREEQPTSERSGSPSDPWAVEPDVGRVAHGVPSRVDRLRCLGNAVVPQVAEHVGRLILASLAP